jgi:hypothetical protein
MIRVLRVANQDLADWANDYLSERLRCEDEDRT